MIQGSASAAAFSPPMPHRLWEPLERRDNSAISMITQHLRMGNAASRSASTCPEVAPLSDPRSQSIDAAKARMAQEIEQRLRFLKEEAEADEVPFSKASLMDFHALMNALGPRVRPSLFLNDNGNLRALWKNDQREQIGLEFLGAGNIKFVIFKLQKGTTLMIRNAGIDSMEKILDRIRSSGAEGLFF